MYEKGKNFEDYIARKLRGRGALAVRSAGSKGVYDIVAFKDDKAYGIQCKTGSARLSRDEKAKIISIAQNYGLIPVLATKERGRIVFINLLTEKKVEI